MSNPNQLLDDDSPNSRADARVVVLFNEPLKDDHGEVVYMDNAESTTSLRDLWPLIQSEFNGDDSALHVMRMYRMSSLTRIMDLTKRAQTLDRSYAPPDPRTFYTIQTRSHDEALRLVSLLHDDRFHALATLIRSIYVDCVYEPPSVTTVIGQMSKKQTYLYKSSGVDSRSKRTSRGGKGSSVRLGIVEHSWSLDHPDLAQLNAHNLTPPSQSSIAKAHGVSVVGVIASASSGDGCIGACSDLTDLRLASYAHIDPRDAAMLVATGNDSDIQPLGVGDVLLIEAQLAAKPTEFRPALPIEANEAERLNVEALVKAGIIVVIPAGNGHQNLDTCTALNVNVTLAPASFHSGAFYVAASGNTKPHTRIHYPAWHWGTNYGSRIDAFSWGDNVVAPHPTNSYNMSFGGTSSASAIVASALAQVQSIARSHGRNLDPSAMRNLLSSTGLAPRLQDQGLIGKMPLVGGAIAVAVPRA